MANEVEIVVRATDKSGPVLDGANRAAKDYGKGLDGVGESADKAETRALGLKDTVDGVATIMQGPGQAGIGAYIQGWADLASGLANFVIPALSAFTITNIKSTASAVASKVAAVATSAATKAWAAAQWVLNAALSANPIGLVIVAVVALVAAIVIAYKKSETFRSIVQALGRGAVTAFKAMWNAISAVVSWIRANWPKLFAILTGPVGLAVRWIVTHWDKISSAAKSVPRKIKAAFSNLYNIITAPIRNAVNAATSWLNGLMDKAKSAGKSVWNNTVGRIPGFAHGGIVGAAGGGPRSGLTMVGEQGRELVRLPAGSRVYSNNATEQMMGAGGGGVARVELVWVGGNAGDEFFTWLKKNIRVRGGRGSGSVQMALGS